MTETETRVERRNWKQRQRELFARPDFIARRVEPLVPELTRGWDPLDCQAEIVRSKANNRITVRYTFGRAVVVYGKLYFDPSLGRTTHSLLAQLWKQGFAAGSGLEIPHPLGFIEEANLLLMRRADGMPLNEFARAGPIEKVLTAARLAARWLAKYHDTEIPGLPIQLPCEQIEILNIADALAKTAAECPGSAPFLIDMLHGLHAVAPRGNSSSPLVPVHGQFRPAHVLFQDNRATVIDIEKICLADPAKDVARFVHVLKKDCFEEGGDVQRTEELVQEFIAEYRKFAPLNLVNLAYFRALLAYRALAKLLKNHKVDEDERQSIGEMYRLEFKRFIDGTADRTVAGQHREVCNGTSPREGNETGTTGREISFSMQQPVLANSISAAPLDKDALARKAAELTKPEFIETRILPLIRFHPNGSGADCHAQIVQNTGTGRLTLSYNFGPENLLFAKLYCDDLGPRCHEINCALWERGFNANGRYQVPQPVAFLGDHNLLLMRCVPGTPLGAAFDGHPSADIVAGSHEAAKWLVALHRSSLKMGTAEPDWDSLKLFRMAGRLIKAAAVRREKVDLIRELMGMLEKRVAKLPASRPLVFTHGRYHHDHVFLSAAVTAVIDLDRCRPSDPAKDAAEFVRVLRLTAFKRGFNMNRAEKASTTFLSTYLAEIPEAAASLGCYWAAFMFHSLLAGWKKGSAKGQRSWDELMEFYVGEIMRALAFAQ